MEGYIDDDGSYVIKDQWFEFEPDTDTLKVYWKKEQMFYTYVSYGRYGDEGLIFITHWECYKPQIRRIEVMEGMTTIGTGAFYGCMLAESVSLPKSLKKIEAEAFSACASLRSIDIPEGVEKIQEGFWKCLALEEINVSESNPYYYSRDGVLFSRDGTLKRYPPNKAGETYRVPEDTKNVSRGAFLDAQHLKDVILPEGFDGTRPAVIGNRQIGPQESGYWRSENKPTGGQS